jgi:hypothetical protein
LIVARPRTEGRRTGGLEEMEADGGEVRRRMEDGTGV